MKTQSQIGNHSNRDTQTRQSEIIPARVRGNPVSKSSDLAAPQSKASVLDELRAAGNQAEALCTLLAHCLQHPEPGSAGFSASIQDGIANLEIETFGRLRRAQESIEQLLNRVAQ